MAAKASSIIFLASNTILFLSPSTSKDGLSGMASISNLDHLSNPLATLSQLYSLEDDDQGRAGHGQSLRYAQAILTQAAGVLLRLPQEVIATSLVLLQRFWVEGHGQGHANADPKVHTMLSSAHIVGAK